MAAKKKGTVVSGGERKFPVTTKGEARNAMARLNQAKPQLTPDQKKTVARAVEKKLGHSTEQTRKILGKKTSK